MKVYISGMSGSGKSTLIQTLERDGILEGMGMIGHIYPYADRMVPFLMGKDVLGLQKYIFHRMAAEQYVIEKYPGHMIIDRCPVDWLAYTRAYISMGYIEYLDICDELSSFDTTFGFSNPNTKLRTMYIKPTEEYCKNHMLQRDDWEKSPWASERAIHEILYEFDLQWEIYKADCAQVVTITTTDLEKRMDIVKQTLQKWMDGT